MNLQNCLSNLQPVAHQINDLYSKNIVTSDLTMTTLTVTLPESLTLYLQEQIASGFYTNANDYIQDLIQQDRSRKQYLEPLILEGITSGAPTPMTSDDWNAIRQSVRNNHSDRTQNS
jgi:antitoxin ParD1/3/4